MRCERGLMLLLGACLLLAGCRGTFPQVKESKAEIEEIVRTKRVSFFVMSVPVTNTLRVLEEAAGVPVVFVTKKNQEQFIPSLTIIVNDMLLRNALDWVETLTGCVFTVEDGRILYHVRDMETKPGPWITVEPVTGRHAGLCWIGLSMRSVLDDITQRTNARFVVRPEAEERVLTRIINADLPKWYFDSANFATDLDKEERELDEKLHELEEKLNALAKTERIARVKEDIESVKRELHAVRRNRLANRELVNPMDGIARLAGLECTYNEKENVFMISVRKAKKLDKEKEE